MGKEVQMNSEVTVENTTEEKLEYAFISTEEAEALSVEEIEAKVEELNTLQEEHIKYINSKMYKVNLGSQKNLTELKKWIEKEVQWDHKSVPNLIAVYDGLKKSVSTGVDEEGNAYMSSIVVSHIYQYLLTFTGKGYIDAKKYITLLAKSGGPISEATKELADDQEYFRNIHTDLATLDTVLEAKKHGIKVNTDTAEDSSEEVSK